MHGCFERDAIAIYAVMLPERHRLPKTAVLQNP
jgi:hypothetical protein